MSCSVGKQQNYLAELSHANSSLREKDLGAEMESLTKSEVSMMRGEMSIDTKEVRAITMHTVKSR